MTTTSRMCLSTSLVLLFAFAGTVSAADLPGPLAATGKQIFADDFDRNELPPWRAPIPTFTVADGVLTGSQTRDDHGAVSKAKLAFKDAILECRFRLDGAGSFNVVFDDKAFKGSHAGHVCRVSIAPKRIRLGDDKEGLMRNDHFEMWRDPNRKAEVAKLLAGTSQVVPAELQQRRWYRLTVEIVGDQMRVSIDQKPIAYLKSPGIAHETKSEFGFTVIGGDAQFDDVRVFAAAAKSD